MVTSYSSDTDDDFPSLDTLLQAAKRVSDNAKAGAETGNGKKSPASTNATLAPGRSHPRPTSQEHSADEVKWPSLADLADALPASSSPPLPPLSRPKSVLDSPNDEFSLSSSPPLPPITPRRPLRRLVRGSERKPRAPSPSSSSDSESGVGVTRPAPPERRANPSGRFRGAPRQVIIEDTSESENDVPAKPASRSVKSTRRSKTTPGPRGQYTWRERSDSEDYKYNEEEDADLDGFIVSDNDSISVHESSDELPTESEASDDESSLPPPPSKRQVPESTSKKGHRTVKMVPDKSSDFEGLESPISSSPPPLPPPPPPPPPPSKTPAKTKSKTPVPPPKDPVLRDVANTPGFTKTLDLHDQYEFSSDPLFIDGERYDPFVPPPLKKPAPPKTPKRSPTKSVLTAEQELAKTIREFKKNRERLAEEFLLALDQRVCDGALARVFASTGGMKIVWSKTLRTTAGRARVRNYNRANAPKEGIIELAEKMIDRPDRLYDTLAHEFCHLTTMGIDGEFVHHHGAIFYSWGKKVEKAFPEHNIHVSRCHQYSAETKYHWTCQGCEHIYKRHSKTIDPTKHACGKCKGKLLQTKPKPRAMGAYAQFVKDNMASVKKMNPNTPHKDLMKLIGKKWAEKKDAEPPVKQRTGDKESIPLEVVRDVSPEDDEELNENELESLMDMLKV